MNQANRAKQLVERLRLIPHPEGGHYKESYRSQESFIPMGFDGQRNYSTAIYFLLQLGDFSGFHKIKSDECWHFYAGSTLWIHVIHPHGRLERIELGSDIANGESFQACVPAACWFASEPAPGTGFALVGCTVAPGFDFNDFELAEAAVLSRQFPQHSSLIGRLCRK